MTTLIAPPAATPAFVSPRTAQDPFAFRRSELWFGGTMTGIFFLSALILLFTLPSIGDTLFAEHTPGYGDSGWLYTASILSFVLIIGIPMVFVAVLVGTPLAGRLGERLRAVRTRTCHLLLHAAHAAVVGFVFGTVISVALWGIRLESVLALDASAWRTVLTYGAIGALLAAPSAALGWWVAMRRALRGDRRA